MAFPPDISRDPISSQAVLTCRPHTPQPLSQSPPNSGLSGPATAVVREDDTPTAEPQVLELSHISGSETFTFLLAAETYPKP